SKTFFDNPAARKKFESFAPVGDILTASPINPVIHQSGHPYAFLIGDARQTVEPFTGEGVLFALQDAFIAAQQILARGRTNHFPRFPRHSRVVANAFVSPVLRNPRLSERVTLLGSKMPFLSLPIFNSLFR
ncbi:MAG: NAD(P)/FAD-dependent oxidoreductase, partial [Bacteroidota bacterium]